jgi:opacity protein-like surface antigen
VPHKLEQGVNQMRKLLMLSLVALLVPMTSRAADPVGVSLGLRVGYAPAMGDFAKDQSMSDGVKSQIPVQLDAIYKVNKDIGVGAYFSYGFGQLASDVCPDGASCSASDMRFGVQATYTFNSVKAPLVPWAGLGIGYEIAKASIGDTDQSASGFEFLNLQVGGDYAVTPQFAVGPYLQYSVGQYSKADLGAGSEDITDKAMHEWFGFGIRGKFDL